MSYIVSFTSHAPAWYARLAFVRDAAAHTVTCTSQASDAKLANAAASLLPVTAVTEEEFLSQMTLFFCGVVLSGTIPRCVRLVRDGEVCVDDSGANPNTDDIEAFLRREWR